MFKFCKSYAKVMRKYAWILFVVSSSDSTTGEARNPIAFKPSSNSAIVEAINSSVYYRSRPGKHTSFGKFINIINWFSKTTGPK